MTTPDWDTIAEQEIEARTDAILGDAPYRCSDPPEESCSDAGCPVHGEDGDGTNWWDADERDEGEDDPDFGPEAYKTHQPACVCWDCQGAREEAAPAAGETTGRQES